MFCFVLISLLCFYCVLFLFLVRKTERQTKAFRQMLIASHNKRWCDDIWTNVYLLLHGFRHRLLNSVFCMRKNKACKYCLWIKIEFLCIQDYQKIAINFAAPSTFSSLLFLGSIILHEYISNYLYFLLFDQNKSRSKIRNRFPYLGVRLCVSAANINFDYV